MSNIEGGETVKRVVQLTDADMAEVKMLEDAGVGQSRHVSARAENAIMSLRRQRGTTKGQRFNLFMATMQDAMNSNNPRVKAEWMRANAAYLNTKRSPSSSDVHTDSALSELSTQYANDDYIGEELMPPVVVAKKSDVYYTYGKADRLTPLTSDLISENGAIPEVLETRSTGSYACVDRGNQNAISAAAVANQDAPLNELFELTVGLAERRALAREIRIATILNTATNFNASNRVTLSGADQWNAAGGGSPVGALQTADAALWRGVAPAKTKGACSLNIYNVLSRHEDFTAMFQYAGSPVGLASPSLIASVLGFDDLLVGRARYNTANEGDTASYSRVWGDYFVLLRVAERQTLRSATFGLTMRWSMPGVAGVNQGIASRQWFDPTRGIGGSHFAMVGESEAHEIQSDDSGYIISDPLA